MSQTQLTLLVFYFKLTTCFGPCYWPSSGYKSIYSRKLHSISHKIQGYYKRNRHFQRYVVSKPLA